MTTPAGHAATAAKAPFTMERSYFIVSLVVMLMLVVVSLSPTRGPLIELYDYGEHAACIRELSNHPFNPGNPMLSTDGSTTLRYTPYILLLALLKKALHLNLSTVIMCAGLINLFLFLAGLYLWSREYFRSDALPLYVLITLLFCWGRPFDYSNEYNFRFLLYTAFYPSTFVFSLGFLGLYLLLSFIRNQSYRSYALYVTIACFAFLTHPLTGSFLLLASLLLCMTEGDHRIKNMWLYLLGLPVIAVCALLWPYYSFVDAVIKSTTRDWYDSFRMYLYQADNIYKMGPALLGLPVILLLVMKKQYSFISLGFLSCSFIYVLSYVANIRLGERYIFFVIFFLQLALAWYWSTLGLLSYSGIQKALVTISEKNIHIFFFAIILLLSMLYHLSKFGFEQAGYRISFEPMPRVAAYKNPLESYAFLQGLLREGDIVMTDPLTGWLLPALTGAKITALYHDNPLVPDNDRRVNDAMRFYSPDTPLPVRTAILDEYKVTHVLLNYDRMKENEVNTINHYYQNFAISPNLVDDMTRLAGISIKNDSMMLFQLHTELPET